MNPNGSGYVSYYMASFLPFISSSVIILFAGENNHKIQVKNIRAGEGPVLEDNYQDYLKALFHIITVLLLC